MANTQTDSLPNCHAPTSNNSAMADGVSTSETPNGVLSPKIDPYASIKIPMHDVPAFTPRKKLRVVTIGAGYSGMIFAHKLQYKYEKEAAAIIDHTIYESKSDAGGTWIANSYPGVQCDVPSHIYVFPFQPNSEWSHFYSTGGEIQEYFSKTVRQWNLLRDVKFDTNVEGAYWEEDKAQWRLEIRHKDTGHRTEYADVLISARGILSHWRWPNITGLHDFKGHKCHSADWDHTFDYSNKRIGLIGNGSSAIQILPEISKLPGTKVTCFQRAPTWILSRHTPAKLVGSDDPSYNPIYREEDKAKFRNPEEIKKYRKLIIGNVNRGFKIFVKGSKQQNEIYEFARKQMSDKLNNDPELCKMLIPEFEVGCRRVTPGAGYLESFTKENVQLTMSNIEAVDEGGIRTIDGKYHELDVVICATGFDVTHRPPFPIVGRNGVELGEKWKEEPESYLVSLWETCRKVDADRENSLLRLQICLITSCSAARMQQLDTAR
jgi:cation diffusion facilitator CzcD-associated flavoprotein CzcO